MSLQVVSHSHGLGPDLRLIRIAGALVMSGPWLGGGATARAIRELSHRQLIGQWPQKQ